jgi:putative ABC transport system ATP-binding protein
MSYIIEAYGIFKDFHIGSSLIHALRDIDMYVNKGEFVAIMGPSGSGKSTLLHLLGCLERPTSGIYMLNNIDVLKASDRELSQIRANNIGFVFQTFNLLPQLNVFENVELPFLYSSSDDGKSRERAIKAIEQVGLIDRLMHRPSELSGGEMQRVAIARALAIGPILILADEPTGNLDSETSFELLELFQDINNEGSTIIMVTHNSEVASLAQSVMTLRDGRFVEKIEA